eukprot:m.82265 g.82265  ORF g.82265 m.82265 type:complete len:616 (-) comp25502_c0_seq1:258-2105(-)
MSTVKNFITDPNTPCPRWPKDATDVVTIPAQFERVVAAHGDKAALMFKASKEAEAFTPVSWKEYHQNASNVAKAMMAQGMQPTDSVSILAFNSPEWFYATFGAIMMGGIAAGIYGTNNADGCWFVANHSKAKIVFVDTKARLDTMLSVKDKLPELKTIVMWSDNLTHDEVPTDVEGVMSWDAFIASGKSIDDATLAERVKSLDAGKTCFLSYTSGTTGRPKAVMHSHDTINHACRSLFTRMFTKLPRDEKWGNEERGISYLPLSHVAGSIPMFGQMCAEDWAPDTTYFAFPDALKGSISASLKEVKPTWFIGVPRVWEKFCAGLKPACGVGGPLHGKPTVYARGALGLQAVKAAFAGSAPVDDDILTFFDSIDIAICDIYGMTENFALSHCNVEGERKYGSVGRSVPGGETKLADGTNEILTRSRSTMLGYMYNEEKTVESIDSEGWLHTGDVGSLNDEGFYTIVGRIKELIITAGGENCAPVVLEAALKKHLPAISNVMMIGDKRKFISCVFTLQCTPTATGGFTDQLDGASAKVDPDAKTIKDAQASAVWKKYLDDGVAKANEEAISKAQQTKKWIILSSEFSIPTGELGPTLKLKRIEVNKNFEKEIEGIYA